VGVGAGEVQAEAERPGAVRRAGCSRSFPTRRVGEVGGAESSRAEGAQVGARAAAAVKVSRGCEAARRRTTACAWATACTAQRRERGPLRRRRRRHLPRWRGGGAQQNRAWEVWGARGDGARSVRGTALKILLHAPRGEVGGAESSRAEGARPWARCGRGGMWCDGVQTGPLRRRRRRHLPRWRGGGAQQNRAWEVWGARGDGAGSVRWCGGDVRGWCGCGLGAFRRARGQGGAVTSFARAVTSSVSVQTSSASVLTSSVSVQTSSASVLTSSVSVQTSSVSVQTSSASVLTSSVSVQTSSASVQTSSASVQTSSASVLTSSACAPLCVGGGGTLSA
jgi:hypothetical protein